MSDFGGESVIALMEDDSVLDTEYLPEGDNASTTGKDSTLQLQVAKYEDSKAGSKSWAHLRVIPPTALPGGDKKENIHFVFVVDVSGSMGSDVEAVGADGTKECNGFSILDLVKHSLLTIVNSLKPAHMATLISFSDDANVEFVSLKMSKTGLKKAEHAIKKLAPTACTNLWAGLRQGYDTVKETADQHPEYRSEIMLFTDGMPNVEPPRGHIPTIQRYLKSEEIPMSHSVRTYGFGYSLHSKLLEEIAVIGRGSFNFIPDASLVGTIFIHSLADILASVPKVQNLKLRLGHTSGAESNKLKGLNTFQELGFHGNSNATEYFLGNMEVGQPRDFIIENPDLNAVALRYRENGEDVILKAKDFLVSSESELDSEPHLARAKMTDMMNMILDGPLGKKKPAQNGYGYYNYNNDLSGLSLAEKQKMVEDMTTEFAEEFKTLAKAKGSFPKKLMEESFVALSVADEKADLSPKSPDLMSSTDGVSTTDRSTSTLFEGIVEDLKGEVTLSVESDESWRRWGVFYLRSLCMAHQLQKRNNFKDHGVQHYGGSLLDKEIDRVNDVFDTLPPPTASNKDRCGRKAVAVHSMSTYNNCYGGCFLPDCKVVMYDGSQRRCDTVRRGDIVKTKDGLAAKILCVVKIVGSNMKIVKFNDSGLGITPWHPMLSAEGEWVFPAEYAEKLKLTNPEKVDKVPTDVVYNFMLESAAVSSAKTHSEMDVSDLLARTSPLKDHTMLINGVPAVTFGHGMEDNAVVKHSYWGNMQAMLRDLTAMIGWNDGFVELVSETACIKDPKTNLVVKMVQKFPESDGDLTDGCCLTSPKQISSPTLPSIVESECLIEGVHGGDFEHSCGLVGPSVGRVESFVGIAY